MGQRRAIPVAALLWLTILGVTLALTAPPASAQLLLQPVIGNLTSPVAIAHAGDGSGRLFIAEQTGKIKVFDGTALLPTPFLDIQSLVSCCGEQGLLGLAFHPDYASPLITMSAAALPVGNVGFRVNGKSRMAATAAFAGISVR